MSISSLQAPAPPEASQRIEADVAAPAQASPLLMEASQSLSAAPSVKGMNLSLAKAGKIGTADLIFHDVDTAEAAVLNAETMPLNSETNIAKNEGSEAGLAVVIQDGKEYLDLNHEDPFSANAKHRADHKIGIAY